MVCWLSAPSTPQRLQICRHLHTDPFDRLLVAQAHLEPLRLITRDTRLAGYGAMVEVV